VLCPLLRTFGAGEFKMIQIMRFLSLVVSIYMMVIFFRIILTWFSWERNSRFMSVLAGITDPYLNWFRRFSFLKAGFVDFSPIAALGVLSVVNRIFSILAAYGKISIGIILALILQALWGIISFLIIFMVIILVLRLVYYFAAPGSSSPFWRIVDGMSAPLLYRINRILFRNRIVNYRTGILISVALLLIIYFVIKTAFYLVSGLLEKLPF